jgi:hypothetical protein
VSGSVNGPGADIGSSPTNTVTGFTGNTPCSLTGVIVTPAEAAAGQTDLTTAYNAIQGMAGCTDLSGVDLGTYTAVSPLAPGCYKFTAGAVLTGTLNLRGATGAQWIFQVATTLDVSANANVVLTGGAIPDNVRWAVGTTATLRAGSHTEGNVIAAGSIIMQANASVNGRVLSRGGAVDMTSGGAVVSKP